MSDSPLILGVDAGGTKTDAVLCTLSGDVVARAVGGGSNYQDTGVATAREVWRGLLDQLGATTADVRASAWGISGLDRPRDAEILDELVAAVDAAPTAARDIVNDTFLILSAGSETGAGVALVSGTGSNCVGMSADGRRDRIGGLAYEFGDGGSGTDIGRDGLRAAFRGDDGRGAPTLLTEMLRDRFDLDRLDDLVDAFVADAATPANPGLVAPLVFDAATLGDRVATDILEAAGRELGASARILAERLFSRGASFPLVLGGSVFQLGTAPAMRDATVATVRDAFPGVRAVVPDVPPVVGALLLAADKLDSSTATRAELAQRLAEQLRTS